MSPRQEPQHAYTSNRWLGALVLSLFVGRILYRWTLISAAAEPVSAAGQPDGSELLFGFQQLSSPWTVAILFVLLGY